MSKTECTKKRLIGSDVTVVDIVSQYREAEAVFKRYNKKAGVRICCEVLFGPLSTVT